MQEYMSYSETSSIAYQPRECSHTCFNWNLVSIIGYGGAIWLVAGVASFSFVPSCVAFLWRLNAPPDYFFDDRFG